MLRARISQDKRGTYVLGSMPYPTSRTCPFMAATFRNFLRPRRRVWSNEALSPVAPPSAGLTTSRARIEWDRAVVLSVARGIEPDAGKVLAWFNGDPIHELGGKTAQQLIDEGTTAPLLDMLVMIRSGRRDH